MRSEKGRISEFDDCDIDTQVGELSAKSSESRSQIGDANWYCESFDQGKLKVTSFEAHGDGTETRGHESGKNCAEDETLDARQVQADAWRFSMLYMLHSWKLKLA